MTVTTTTLTRAAGLAAVAAGLLYVGVQINHPHLDVTVVNTAEYAVRQTAKILFAALSLAGITGMYLRQVKQTGVLGLLGYLLFSTGLLALLTVQVIAVCVLPALALGEPGYVNDVLAVATGGTATGDIGLFQTLSGVAGAGYIGGGLLFGIALFRAGILARWAAALLAVAALATATIPLLPMISQRLFAIPVGVALIGLGYSLWREQRSVATRPVPSPATPRLNPTPAA
ncbi:hypothetical protein [Pseudonocardia broussonetiae]|uniref:DUF4386 family protein n=1 Tax=Pseudonocardia broussonetiae TaxID=2736640 RepID=A0A6M6JLM5_9PSEU|nr:hypothetical protein [Pseudonocardia broussonetiae]QJY49024.1 hypothetical protein HOP40_27285 [Pseudonocardia broussonetiae]